MKPRAARENKDGAALKTVASDPLLSRLNIRLILRTPS